MPQILDLGEQGIHELPDDATPEEIQAISDSLTRPQKTVNPNRPQLESEMKSLRSSRKLSDLTESALGYGVDSATDFGRKLFNLPNNLINAASGAVGGPRLVNNFNGLDLSGGLTENLRIPLQAAEQALNIPGALTQEQGGVTGALQSIEGTASGLTDPNMLVTLPAFASGAGTLGTVGRGLMTADMARHVPEAHARANEVFNDPNATQADKVRAGVDALTADAMFAGVAGQIRSPGPMLKVPEKGALTGRQQDLAAAGGKPIRELSVPVPRDPFLQPGIPELADAALREAQQRIIDPVNERPAFGELQRAMNPPKIEPISAITGGKEASSQLERKPELKYQFRTPEEGIDSIKSTENLQLKKPDGTQRHEIFPDESPKSPVWGIEEKLQQRDLKGAVEQLLGQPSKIQRKVVDAVNDVNRKGVSLDAAERTIFNELWDKVYQESLKKGDSNATKNRPKPEVSPVKYPKADVGELPTETGGGDLSVKGVAGAEAKKIADDLGLGFERDFMGQWGFKVRDAQGKDVGSFSIKSGSTPEAIKAKAESKLKEFEGSPALGEAPVKETKPTPESIISRKRGETTLEDIDSISNLDSQRLFTEKDQTGQVKYPPQYDAVFAGIKMGSEAIKNLSDSVEKYGKETMALMKEAFSKEKPPTPERMAELSLEMQGAQSKQMWASAALEGAKKEGGNYKTAIEIATKRGELPEFAKEKTAEKPADIITRLESLKVNPKEGLPAGQVFTLPHPDAIKVIGKQTWNSAIDVAIASLKAGKAIGKAIDDAIVYLRRQVSGWDESKIRANLNSIIEKESPAVRIPAGPGAGSPPRPPTGTGTPASGTPSRSPVTLDDVYKRFEPNPTTKTPIKEKVSKVVESLRTGFSSKFRPLNKLAEDIADMYGRKTKDVAGIFEQLKGSQGKAEADIYRFDQDVSKAVKGHEKDFNAYLFLKRTLDRLNQDAADKAAGKPVRRAVSNYTIPEVQEKLNLLENQLGPDSLAKVKSASDQFQNYMDEALRLQVESGRMSTEVYQSIKDGNSFYAPFKLLKYIEESSRPEGSGARIDTMADFTKAMEGIEDADFKLADMLASGRSSIAMSRILADKNMAMRHLSELAAFDTQGAYIKKLGPKQDAPTGTQAVNVLENGEQQRYAVNKDVAGAVQIYGSEGASLFARALSASSIPFRAGATALNLPFQISNLLADLPRQALVSKYGINSAANLVRYPYSFIEGLYSSIAGDVFGHNTKLFQDFLDSGVAGTTIQQYLTPESFRFKEPNNISKSKKLASTVLNTIPHFANAIEQTSKIVGVGNAMRTHGVTSGKELARQIPEAITELRRFSGSPDFGRIGSAAESARLNLLYMFLNARIQGSVADVGRLSGRDGGKTAAATWAKIGLPVGMATAYLYYLNNSDEYKDDFAKRPAQEKQNYWLIPKDKFITTEDGEKIRDFWRVPKREISKWVANATESALDFAHEKDAQAASRFGKSMLQDIFPVNIQGNTFKESGESVMSGLNPVIKAPLEFYSGRDFYRHRDLIPDTMRKASPEEQYTARTSDAFKKLAVAMPDVLPEGLRSPIVLENLTRNLTAGLFTQFLPRKPVEGRTALENQPLLQRFQALPYTDNEQFKEQMSNLERAGADELLKRHRIAVKVMDDNPKDSLESLASKVPKDPAIIKHLADLYVAKQNGATAQDRQIISLPVKQRAQYVADQLKSMSPENKNAKILDLARKRILTEAVLQEMPDEFK